MLKKTLSIVAIAGVVLALAGPAGAAVVTTGLSIHYRADDVDNLGNPGTGATTTLVNLANPGTHDGTIVSGSGIVQNGGEIGTPYEYGVVLNDTSQTYITANTYRIAGGNNKVTAATWEFWLRADSGSYANRGALYGEFVADGSSNLYRHYLRMEEIGTEPRRVNYDEYGGGGGNAASDSPLFDTGEFTQIAVTKSGDTVRFYKDGLQVGSTKTSSEAFFGGTITRTLMGIRGDGNESFDGQFNIIRVYDAVLTPAEILGNYNADIIPEPATMSLLAIGGLGVLLKRRRRRA